MKLASPARLLALFTPCLSVSIVLAGVARADDATVTVGSAPRRDPAPMRYADPPLVATSPSYDALRSRDYDGERVDRDAPVVRELYRAPFRLHLGPMGVTTGRSVGAGLGLAADFGSGSVGFRMAAAWLRGEPSGGSSFELSPLSEGLAQYTGEVTIDFHKRGPVHPVFGLGLGVAHINRGDGAGNLGIGTARLGLEYAIPLDDADVRLGAGLTGVLPGPADREVADVRGYALIGASLGVGF